MAERKEYKLGDITDVQTGPFGSQLHQSDYRLIGTPIITVEHLGENKIIHTDLPLVGDEDKERLKKYTLHEGDIVFSRVGSVDRRAYVGKDEDGWMFSGRCLRVRGNKDIVHPKYLSYYFGQDGFKEHIRMIAVGATMPSINTEILSNVIVTIPPLPEQRAIASILSSLDDKIDLLHRQNKTLEALAETLFRQWFVEEAEEGWEVVKLRDVCETITKGTTPTTLGKQFKEFGINFIKAESLTDEGGFIYDKFAFIDGDTNILLSRSRIQIDDILITIAGTIGRIAYVTKEILPANTNQAIGIMRINKAIINPYFIYCLFKTSEIRNDLDGRVIHAVQPNLSLGEIGSLEFKLPPKIKLNSCMDKLLQLFLIKERNTNQIYTLIQLRDTLLPKLMSGEVRVGG